MRAQTKLNVTKQKLFYSPFALSGH